MSKPPERTNKVTIVGQGAVGKSSLTLQFIYNEFMDNYEPTKGDYYRKVLESTEGNEIMDILDTAGEEIFVSSTHQMYINGEGFVLVCSVDDAQSIAALAEFRNNILMSHSEMDSNDLPMVVALNKIDLLDNGEDRYKAELAEAEGFAEKWNVPLIRTSAKSRLNVDEIFLTVNAMINRQKDANSNGVVPAKKKKRFHLKKFLKKYVTN